MRVLNAILLPLCNVFMMYVYGFYYISTHFFRFTPFFEGSMCLFVFFWFSTFFERRCVRGDDPKFPGGFEEEWRKIEDGK